MAKVVSDEILKLKIIVNGDEAQKKILDLEVANNELSKKIVDLNNKEKDLAKKRSKNAIEIAKIKAQVQEYNKTISENNKAIDDEIKSMNIMNLTIDQLRRRINDLNFTMKHMDPNSESFAANRQELQELSNRLREVRNGAEESGFSLSRLADRFNHYSGLAVAFAGALAGVALSIQNVIDMNNKMADAMSAVEKTTGLTKKEVEDLTKSFVEFDTRTSKIDLLKIAEIGGRLGIPKAELKGFVEEVDKAYVALGDSFSGGVAKVAEGIGKIAGLYKETKGQEFAVSINQIGSALNELGANGAASEENIADFTRRVGALPEALKPSITDAMALGAALEESGIDAERGGTAYANFVSTASKETAKFAEVMGLTQSQVKEMINTDPAQFFLTFSEGLKGMSATDVSTTLDYLKLGDQYVKSIVGAATENTDRFRKSMSLSAQAAAEATSLQEEFNKVNNNAAAIYEKVRKKFMAMFTSKEVASTLNWIIAQIGKLLGVVEDTTGRVTYMKDVFITFMKIVIIATTAIVSYNTAIALSNLTLATLKDRLLAYTVVQKISNVYNQAAAFLQNAYNLAIGYGQLALGRLTSSTAMQTAAQIRLNIATVAHPFGAVLAVVLALGAAYLLFSKRADEAAEKQKKLNEINAETEKGIVSQKNELQLLLNVAKDESASKERRLQAIKKLNEISPEYLGNLTLENINTMKAAEAVKAYTDALLRNSRIKVLTKKLDDISEKKIDKEKESLWDQETGGSTVKKMLTPSEIKKMDANQLKQMAIWRKQYGENYAKSLMSQYSYVYEKRAKGLQQLNDEAKSYSDEIADLNQKMTIADEKAKSGYNVPAGGEKVSKSIKSSIESSADKARKKYEQERERMLESGEASKQRLEELEAERIRNTADMLKEGYEKEREIILAEQEKTIAALDKKKVSETDFKKIRAMIDKEKGQMKLKLQEIEFQWMEENGRISGLQEQEKEKSLIRLEALKAKYDLKDVQTENDTLERKLANLKRAQNEELAQYSTVEELKAALNGRASAKELNSIKTWEDAKKVLNGRYQRKELDILQAHLQNMLLMYDGLDLSILSEDQKTVVLKNLEQLKDKLAEVALQKKEIANGDADKDKLGGRLSSFGGKTDVLGLTSDQWKAMFTNTNSLTENIQKIGAAVQIAQQLFATYSSFVQANEQKMLQEAEFASQRKQTRLDRQLKAGLINQEQYKKLSIANEQDLDKKKALLEYQAAKRQRTMQIGEAIASTAMIILNAANTKPFLPLGLAMSGVAATMGAMQLATIMSAPLPTAPGAQDGYYPVLREQDNKFFNARRRKSSSGIYNEPTMLVGEQGKNFPELVVSGEDLKKIDPNITNMFMRDIQRVKGYEKGLYPEVTNINNSEPSDVMLQVLVTLQETKDVMTSLKKFGIKAYIDKTAKNGMDIEEMIENYRNIKNRNKHG